MEPIHSSVWRSLRTGESSVPVRVGVTIILGLMLAAVALFGVWAFTKLVPPTSIRLPNGQVIFQRSLVRDRHVLIALLVCAGVWFLTIMRLWRLELNPPPNQRHAALVAPALKSLALSALMGLAIVIADHYGRPDEEVVITAVCLLGGAVLVALWLPALHHYFGRRPAINAENQVNVNCPSCGYSLIGLRDLRCPECGAQFTIDELIRAQNYAGSAAGHVVSTTDVISAGASTRIGGPQNPVPRDT